MAHVSGQSLWRLFLNDVVQRPQKFLNAFGTVPANDQRRDFVADGIEKNRAVFGKSAGVIAGTVIKLSQARRVSEVATAWSRANVGHEEEASFERNYRDPIWRRGIQADRIHADFAHAFEVLLYLRAFGEW